MPLEYGAKSSFRFLHFSYFDWNLTVFEILCLGIMETIGHVLSSSYQLPLLKGFTIMSD